MRKRARYLRLADRGRKRPKGPTPTDGWLIDELAKLAGVLPRTVRYYRQRGILSPPIFRGTATRYSALHLTQLIATRRMLAEGLELAVIKTRLNAMTAAELKEYASTSLATEPLPEAPRLSNASLITQAASVSYPTPWIRLVPHQDIEIFLRGDAAQATRELVQAWLERLAALP